MGEFEMRKIAEDPQKVFDRAKYILNSNWIIQKWYEKIIFCAMIIWAIYSVIKGVLLMW